MTRAGEIRSSAQRRARARERRARLKAAGFCINGEKHGKATHGVLCAACRRTHKESA
jgi:hypothetical protein